jgi:MYXO-CTERM domain-containing protein
MKFKLFSSALFFLFTASAVAPLANATSIVAPNGDATTEGNSNNVSPFSAGWFGTNPTARYQQVYNSNQFAAAGSTMDIGAIAFRFASIVAAQTETDVFPDVQIDLSTTAAAADGLSATFANNVGANNTVVYSGPLTLVGTPLGDSPNPFNLVINLQKPFIYTPAQGNLLLDISIDGAGSFPLSALDADFTAGDGTSRVWTPFNGSVNSSTGNVDTLGLVTEFLPPSGAPEPSTMAMGGLALVAAGLLRKRRRNC